MNKYIKWGVIFALMSALTISVGWLCYQWGESNAEKEAAEQRQQAVEEAVQKAREKYQSQLAEVKKQRQQYKQRLVNANKALESKDERIENLDNSDKICFDEESLTIFNSY